MAPARSSARTRRRQDEGDSRTRSARSTFESRPSDCRRTLSGAAGIGVAVGVYGVSFGVLAVAAGLSPAQAVVMSMLLFTGASQFAFVGVLASGGGGALAATGPAVMLAVRNAAYGLSLAPILRGRL